MRKYLYYYKNDPQQHAYRRVRQICQDFRLRPSTEERLETIRLRGKQYKRHRYVWRGNILRCFDHRGRYVGYIEREEVA